jgi:HSP20 family protein
MKMMIEKYFNIPRWERRSAFTELSRLQERMNRLMGSFFDSSLDPRGVGVFPPVNISENSDHIIVRAELPGVKADELDISISNNNLTITGERKIKDRGVSITYHRRERNGGTFNRIISLPSDIDADHINAGLSNGVLTITLPKVEAAKPKQITVK